MANRISVIIDVAADKANRSLKSFKTAVSEADGAFGKLKAGGGAAMQSLKANMAVVGPAVGAAFLKLGQVAVNAASELEESINAVNVSFGDASSGIHDLGEDSVESFGLSTAAFNGFAVMFSKFAETIAGPGGDVAATIDDISTRGADLASVYDVDVSEAMQKFQSGLAGQSEPLRAWGVDVSAATVNQYALDAGIIQTGESMTEGQKVQARYLAIMDQTSETAGDFANTSDSLANQQRILNAQLTNMSAELGQHLTPALAEAVGGMNDLLSAADNLGLIDAGMKFREMTSATTALTRATDVVRGKTDLYGKTVVKTTTEAEFLALTQGNLAENAVKLAGSQDTVTKATDEGTDAAGDMSDALNEAAVATKVHADALERQVAELERQAEALEESAQALEDQIDAQYAAADAQFALNDAEDTFVETLEELDERLKDSELSLRDLRDISDDAAESALDVAQAQVRLAEETATAAGKTYTATQRQDTMNTSMLKSAAAANGPARSGILNYIATVNQIPAQKMTEIQAAIDRGDVAEANRLLNDASRTRQAAINADANTWAAEQALNNAARTRTVLFKVNVPKGANIPSWYAKGTKGAAGGLSVVGEQGPELVNLDRGDKVLDAGASRKVGQPGRSTTINNYFPAGTRPDDVARATRRYNDVQGPV